MKQKSKPAKDTLDRVNYTAAANVAYCLNNAARCYMPLIFLCALTVAVNVAVPILTAYLPKSVVAVITGQGGIKELTAVVLIYTIGIAILSACGKFLEKYVYFQKYQLNAFYLRKVALKGLTTDYCNQENAHFRALQTESFECCNGNSSPVTGIFDTLTALATGLVGLCVYFMILARLNPLIIVFVALTTAAGYLMNLRIIRWTADHSGERVGYQQRINYINSTAGDVKSGKDIRLYRMASWFSSLYGENMKGLAGWNKQLTRRVFNVSVCDSLLALVREAAVYVYLFYLVGTGGITVADFVLYLGVIAGFTAWMSSILSDFAALSRLSLKINYMRSYLEYPDTYLREGGKKSSSINLPAVIELRDVCYRYSGAESDTLHCINLTIMPGERLAVVGLNGAGKTTLVKLICALTDPTAGQVLYDGVDVREYDREAYYGMLSAVFQQFSLMPVTVAEIVAETPVETADRSRVEDCLKAAGLGEKIQSLPLGVDSKFGKTVYDEGVDFSGGEIQKLLLARALYKSAPVMILDEPTAALDPIAESKLYRDYGHISGGRSTVFISHRLASTSFCDRIILIDNGSIIETGTHDSLLTAGGRYSELFEMQAKYYRENKGGEVDFA